MSNRFFLPGNRWLMAYLAFISAFAPISIDLYLPALPKLTEALNTTATLSSLTISSFLLFFACSMLFWGPLSDKYGRRKILFIGASIYTLSSTFLALGTSIESILFWRCMQAVGSGAISAMALAIVKELLRGEAMEKMVTSIQTVTILAPMLAPVAGGVLLRFTDWRGTFWCLSLCGVLAFLGALCLKETLRTPTQGSVFQVLGRLKFVLQQSSFRNLLLIFSSISMPFMAYIAISAYVYQNIFHLSPQEYSYFFACNAAFSLMGPLLHTRFFRHFNRTRLLTAHMLLVGCGGILLLLFGKSSPYLFALCFAPISLCTSALRPPATILMMQQLSTDSGTVAALINSFALLFGSLSMFIVTLPFWGSYITTTGALACIIALICCLSWLRFSKKL